MHFTFQARNTLHSKKIVKQRNGVKKIPAACKSDRDSSLSPKNRVKGSEWFKSDGQTVKNLFNRSPHIVRQAFVRNLLTHFLQISRFVRRKFHL